MPGRAAADLTCHANLKWRARAACKRRRNAEPVRFVLQLRGRNPCIRVETTSRMAELYDYASRPFAFIVSLHPAATGRPCGDPGRGPGGGELFGQHAIRREVPGRHSIETAHGADVWIAFALACRADRRRQFAMADRGWIANYAFVGVTGDLRRDLFRHLTGHSPSFSPTTARHADKPRHRDIERGIHS